MKKLFLVMLITGLVFSHKAHGQPPGNYLFDFLLMNTNNAGLVIGDIRFGVTGTQASNSPVDYDFSHFGINLPGGSNSFIDLGNIPNPLTGPINPYVLQVWSTSYISVHNPDTNPGSLTTYVSIEYFDGNTNHETDGQPVTIQPGQWVTIPVPAINDKINDLHGGFISVYIKLH